MAYDTEELVNQGGKFTFTLRRISDGSYCTFTKDFGVVPGGLSGDLYEAAPVSQFFQDLVDALGEMTSFEVYGTPQRTQEYTSNLTPTPAP
jgi:hypothetical protein